MKEKINIFISHKGEDEKYIEDFKKMISKHGDYEIRDSSIVETEPNNATNEEYIKSIIRPKIDWAGKVIVIIGKETKESDWVTWEIEYADKCGDKKIIGVFLDGATDDDIPIALNELGDSCVTWNPEQIVEAIEGKTIWVNSQGNIRQNNELERDTC
jgi:hypothetical protein